ncbi:Molybdopterin synthase catalytic subunit [Diplonema papillatum]|nr:Molybdopterin synthase catalytic subunit [Diplonema papillatum]
MPPVVRAETSSSTKATAVQNESGDLLTVAELSNEPLSLEERSAAGAVATFSGTTRDNFKRETVVKLAYEAYGEMAEQGL